MGRCLRPGKKPPARSLPGACLQFVDFAQLRIADVDPAQPVAARRGKQHEVVHPRAHRPRQSAPAAARWHGRSARARLGPGRRRRRARASGALRANSLRARRRPAARASGLLACALAQQGRRQDPADAWRPIASADRRRRRREACSWLWIRHRSGSRIEPKKLAIAAHDAGRLAPMRQGRNGAVLQVFDGAGRGGEAAGNGFARQPHRRAHVAEDVAELRVAASRAGWRQGRVHARRNAAAGPRGRRSRNSAPGCLIRMTKRDYSLTPARLLPDTRPQSKYRI